MGEMDFRVKEVPDPKPYINLDEGNTGLVSLDKLVSTGLLEQNQRF